MSGSKLKRSCSFPRREFCDGHTERASCVQVRLCPLLLNLMNSKYRSRSPKGGIKLEPSLDQSFLVRLIKTTGSAEFQLSSLKYGSVWA